jgi:hypothetical protein
MGDLDSSRENSNRMRSACRSRDLPDVKTEVELS